MKTKLLTLSLCFLCLTGRLAADIHAQGGIESYIGANSMFQLTPWLGIRASLSSQSSLIFKYYNHNLRYQYDGGIDVFEQRASLSNFTGVYYHQTPRRDLYAALSYITGDKAVSYTHLRAHET